MNKRVTYTGLTWARAVCEDCNFEVEAKNALPLGAIHSDKYQHTVHVDLVNTVTYTREGSDWYRKQEKSE